MTSTRYSYRPIDGRRDQRYPLPALNVTLGDRAFVSTNWSLGGLLVAGFGEAMQPRAVISGTFSAGEGVEPVAFTAEVVRFDAENSELALKFVELEPRGIEVLDRALSRRYFRKRR